MKTAPLVLLLLAFPPWGHAAPPFPVLDAIGIRERCEAAFAKAEAAVVRMEKRRSPAGVLEEWNRAQILVEDIAMPAGVFASVHSDKAAREAGDACYARLQRFETRMSQSPALFRRVRDVRTTNPRQERFKRDLLDRFEDAGVHLVPEKRRRLAEINARIETLRQEFFLNVERGESSIELTREELAGAPEQFIARLARSPDGRYVVPMKQAGYGPAIASITDSGVRQRVATAWFRRGGERNLQILDEIVGLRRELAALLGLESYAHGVLRRRMARNPATVDKFLADSWSAIEAKERWELDQIRELKAADTQRPVADTVVIRGDVPYYLSKVGERAAGGEVRSRIPTSKAIEHLFFLASRLYGVRITPRAGATWHADATCHDVHEENGRFVGAICLDPYERAGKGEGAHAIHVFGASRIEKRTPVSVLIASVGHDHVEVGELRDLHHEFGHVLHGVLSETDYVAHSGTRVMMDFVEAPSQMFEAYALDPVALAPLRERCPECQGLDRETLQRAVDADRFSNGVRHANDWRMAAFDMALAKGEPGTALETWNRQQARMQIQDGPGTYRFATTLHLPGGYAAGYYGYLWSRALGEEMLSAFRGDLLDPAVGRRFRRTVLAPGAQEHPADLVRAFLGREPRMEAYFEKLNER